MTKVSCTTSQVFHKRDIQKMNEIKKRIKKQKVLQQELSSQCVKGTEIMIHYKEQIHNISKKKTKVISHAECKCGNVYHVKYSFETVEDVCTFLNDIHS